MGDVAYIVDLRSDTVTKPTESMKQAMISSPLGDDVYGEDPTVKALESKIAKMLGKDAALFVPSGTMANLIATMVHCNKRGAEVLCGDMSHIAKCEQGGVSQIGGVLLTTLKNQPDGTFNLAELEERIRGSDVHEPITMMVAVENTHNMCGGKVIPLDWLDKLSFLAKKHSLLLHMDGARLFNASEFLREDPSRLVRDFDSVSVCFSKGLGAPVGSALVGSTDFINQARRMRKVLGGGMRQVGVLAAAALVALDQTIHALYADHRRAAHLAQAIKDLKLSTFTVDMANQQTNIVLVHIEPKSATTSSMVAQRLMEVHLKEIEANCKTPSGENIVVRASTRNPKALRLVTHLDITDDDIKVAVKKLAYVLKEMDRK